RHGHAADQRDLRQDLGRPHRTCASRGVLAGRHSRAAHPAPGDRASRRNLLGPGMGTSAARIQLLLRQTALCPDHRPEPPPPPPVRPRVGPDLSSQSRLMRFRENHDEPRIAARMPRDAERAAAVAIATLPGATLWHEGQFEGRRVRPPVFLSRRPDEPPDLDLADWYRRLLAPAAGTKGRAGPGRAPPPRGRPGTP